MIQKDPRDILRVIRVADPGFTTRDPDVAVGSMIGMLKEQDVFELVGLGVAAEIF